MTITAIFWPMGWLFNWTGGEGANEPPTQEEQDTARLTVRDYLMDCDLTACESEYGAQMLMAMFPREV